MTPRQHEPREPEVPEVGTQLKTVRPKYKKIVTVILDNDTPSIRKNLHCPNCGRIACNYYSEVRVIIIGEFRECDRPMDILCTRCPTLIRIA